jgi:putative hemolysin
LVNAIKKNEYNNATEFKVNINEQNRPLSLTEWKNLERSYSQNLQSLVNNAKNKYEIFINKLDAALKAKEVPAE